MIAPILHQNRLNQWQTTLELAACPQKVASTWPHWNCAAGFTSPEIWKSFADRCPKIYKISPGKLWHVRNHQCGCSHCSHPSNESCATCTAEKLRIMWPWHHNEQQSMAWLKENLIGQPWIYHAISLQMFPPLTNSGNIKDDWGLYSQGGFHESQWHQRLRGPFWLRHPPWATISLAPPHDKSSPYGTTKHAHPSCGTATVFFPPTGPGSQATRLPFPSFRGFLGSFRCIRLCCGLGRGVFLRLRLLGILSRGVAGHATVGLLTLLGLGETAEGGVHGFVILRGHLLQLLPFLYFLGWPRIFPNPVETNGDRVFPNLPSSCWNHLEGQQTHHQSCVALQTGSCNTIPTCSLLFVQPHKLLNRSFTTISGPYLSFIIFIL